MWLIIVSSVLAFLTGIAAQITDLFRFENDSDKERFKNRTKWTAFVIFLIASGFSGFQLWHNYNIDNLARNKADSVLRATKRNDSIKSDLLFKDNKGLKDSLSRANATLRSLDSSNARLLSVQTQNFVKTAKTIQNSADTLNKYISGSDGFCYVIANSINRGDYIFSIVNPNNYSLRNVQIFANKYSDLDSCTEWRNGTKFLNMDRVFKKCAFIVRQDALSPGSMTENIRIKLIDGWKQKFLIRIEIGNKIYYEEFIISMTDGCIGYKIYGGDKSGKMVSLKDHIDGCLFKFTWNTEFHFKIFDLSLSRSDN